MPETKAKEHPIIFNEWSIKRILAGEKHQTRRVVKPQPPDNADRVEIEENGTLGYFSGDTAAFHDTKTCPYGQPGDVLWVREAFRLPKSLDDISPSEAVKRPPDGKEDELCKYTADGEDRTWHDAGIEMGRKRPSIHMPRELCRLRLRVEDVRVERVQEISASDAFEEGIRSDPSFETDNPAAHATATEMVGRFAQKWNDIHGGGAWQRNEWVWVISFSRIE